MNERRNDLHLIQWRILLQWKRELRRKLGMVFKAYYEGTQILGLPIYRCTIDGLYVGHYEGGDLCAILTLLLCMTDQHILCSVKNASYELREVFN